MNYLLLGWSLGVNGFFLHSFEIWLACTVVFSSAGNLGFTLLEYGLGVGLAALLAKRRVRKIICSFPRQSDSWVFDGLYRDGDIELELVPQGNLAERIRAGGDGIPAFYTKTGVGTLIAEGKEVKEFDGEKYIMERGLFADLAIVHAWKGDTAGNLVYRKTARNFNPMMATAAKVTVAEVEHLSDEPLDPDVVITPGIYIDRLVVAKRRVKDIEQRTVRARAQKGQTP